MIDYWRWVAEGKSVGLLDEITIITEQQKNLAEICFNYGVTTLCHFTHIKNLPMILQYGLLCRQMLNRLKIPYKYNDYYRYDKRLDCISLSVSKINDELIEAFVGRDGGEIDDYVILGIDASLLYREIENERIYCQTNAATSRCRKGNDISDFEAMFANVVEYQTSYGTKRFVRNEIGVKDNETTAPQAEILWQGWIKPTYIKYIIPYKNQTKFDNSYDPYAETHSRQNQNSQQEKVTEINIDDFDDDTELPF